MGGLVGKAGKLLLYIGFGVAIIWLYNVLSADKWAAEDAIQQQASLARAQARQELVRRRVSLDDVFENKCSDRCQGHVAGYEWAFRRQVTDFGACRNDSRSFAEGCRAAVPDVRAIKRNLVIGDGAE